MLAKVVKEGVDGGRSACLMPPLFVASVSPLGERYAADAASDGKKLSSRGMLPVYTVHFWIAQFGLSLSNARSAPYHSWFKLGDY